MVIENYGGLANSSTMVKSYGSRAVDFSTGNQHAESAFCSMLLPMLLGVLSCKNKILSRLCPFSMRSQQRFVFLHTAIEGLKCYIYIGVFFLSF